jgi:hypothetical protein
MRILSGRAISGPLSFSDLRRQIIRGRPVCARILWWGIEPNAHFVVISGCHRGKNGSRWLDVEDSYWGSSTWRYEVFRSNYKYARGRWVATYLVRPEKQ